MLFVYCCGLGIGIGLLVLLKLFSVVVLYDDFLYLCVVVSLVGLFSFEVWIVWK